LLAANATEWLEHKHVMHELGKKKDSFRSFHWNEHHRECRRSEKLDHHYEAPIAAASSKGKEALALVAGVSCLMPLAPIAPFFVGTMAYAAVNYYRVHKRSHLDPLWARKHVPWHFDHHMGPNPHANWCVTKPWFDEIMGTREPYVGTEREHADKLKRRRRKRPVRPAKAPKRAA
ncbi:MAG: hypothetical protein AAF645_24150, partial [Myxococcota bacterium]